MELLDYPIKLKSGTEPVWVHVFSDVHRAAHGCDSRKLRSDIAKLKFNVEERGEKHVWLGGGDWSNAIGPKDRRFDTGAVAPEFVEHLADDLFGAEARVLAREFMPIKKWGIGIGMGNHEDAIARHGEFNPSIAVARDLDLPYLGYSAVVRFRLMVPAPTMRSATLILYWHHGRGAARSAGAKLNMLQSMEDVVEADVYVVGHTHEIVDAPKAKLRVPRRGALRLLTRELLFFNSGTYLKAYSTDMKPQDKGFDEARHVRPDYAEKAAYTPSVIGHNGFKMWLECGTNGWRVRVEKVQF